MTPAGAYDVAVIGGGIMGCTTALHLARGGMSVAVLERGALCREATGANPGTLSMQTKNARLMAYALKSLELWRGAPAWLGADVGFQVRGGLVLAFDDDEADLLNSVMVDRRAGGAPIEIVGANRARRIEPGISDRVVAASYCPIDGYAYSALAGMAYRAALVREGVTISEGWPVDGVERTGGGFVVRARNGTVGARRVVLAGGAWLKKMGRWLGVELPLEFEVPQVVVTERLPPVVGAVICVVSRRLTLKQAANGTVLIGGGWRGIGDLERGGVEAIPESIVGNIRLARYAVPALGRARVVRTWLGLSTHGPDALPVIGALPGADDAFVIGGARSGFTHGPYMGRLLAQRILGHEPEMPLFDPNRKVPES